MKALLESPVFLLLAVGGLIGVSFPLGKIANTAGIDAVLWSLVISGGSGLVLLAVLLLRRYRVRPDAHFVRYAFISGLLSYVLPNLLMFSAIPRLGAGFVGLMFTLSPVLTLAMSMAGGVRMPNRLGMTGVAVGFAGALVLTTSRGDVSADGTAGWLAIAFLIPVFLAAGNIYREVDWPADREPLELSAFSNLAAGLLLVFILLATRGGLPFDSLVAIPLLPVAQIFMSSIVFALFFRLQKVGGPVYLSQIGYVAAAVGLFSGLVFLGERYGISTWAGAAIIAVGIGLTIIAQTRARTT